MLKAETSGLWPWDTIGNGAEPVLTVLPTLPEPPDTRYTSLETDPRRALVCKPDGKSGLVTRFVSSCSYGPIASGSVNNLPVAVVATLTRAERRAKRSQEHHADVNGQPVTHSACNLQASQETLASLATAQRQAMLDMTHEDLDAVGFARTLSRVRASQGNTHAPRQRRPFMGPASARDGMVAMGGKPVLREQR